MRVPCFSATLALEDVEDAAASDATDERTTVTRRESYNGVGSGILHNIKPTALAVAKRMAKKNGSSAGSQTEKKDSKSESDDGLFVSRTLLSVASMILKSVSLEVIHTDPLLCFLYRTKEFKTQTLI